MALLVTYCIVLRSYGRGVVPNQTSPLLHQAREVVLYIFHELRGDGRAGHGDALRKYSPTKSSIVSRPLAVLARVVFAILSRLVVLYRRDSPCVKFLRPRDSFLVCYRPLAVLSRELHLRSRREAFAPLRSSGSGLHTVELSQIFFPHQFGR